MGVYKVCRGAHSEQDSRCKTARERKREIELSSASLVCGTAEEWAALEGNTGPLSAAACWVSKSPRAPAVKGICQHVGGERRGGGASE